MQQSYPLLCKQRYSIDDALTNAANWVLALGDMEKSLEEISLVDDFPRQCQNTFCFHFESKYL